MLSLSMKEIIQRLSNDWDFIEIFLDDPDKAIKSYELTDEEKNALLARNIEDLVSLGISEMDAEIVLSGAHSKMCPPYTLSPVLFRLENKEQSSNDLLAM